MSSITQELRHSTKFLPCSHNGDTVVQCALVLPGVSTWTANCDIASYIQDYSTAINMKHAT